MQSERITGFVLLGVGISTICFALFSVYQVFTKQSHPIELFSFPSISIDTSQIISSQIDQVELPPEFAKIIEQKKQNQSQSKPTEILSAEILNQTSNVFAHLFLMGFVASIGQKIASLGIMLLRPIEVKVKESKSDISK